jgi:hypothetical protein
LTAIVITRDEPSARGGLEEALSRWRPPLLLVPPEADDAPWVEAARAMGTRVVPLQPALTLGSSHAQLQVDTRRGDEWTLIVRHGARTIALGARDGDAAVIRENRSTRVTATVASVRAGIDIHQGETMQISTDGRSLRLAPPRGRGLTTERCESHCRPLN